LEIGGNLSWEPPEDASEVTDAGLVKSVADLAMDLHRSTMNWLVVWNIFLLFLGIIIPTDELHDFSEGLKPPTSEKMRNEFKQWTVESARKMFFVGYCYYCYYSAKMHIQ